MNPTSEADGLETAVSKNILATTMEASSLKHQRAGATFSASSRAASAARAGFSRKQSAQPRRFGNVESAAELRRPKFQIRPRVQTARPDGRANTERDKIPLPAGPGPGSYNLGTHFPKGPAARIETKKRRDSLFLNTIDRTVSPGPAAHVSRDAPINAGVGSRVIPFGDTKRFAKN